MQCTGRNKRFTTFALWGGSLLPYRTPYSGMSHWYCLYKSWNVYGFGFLAVAVKWKSRFVYQENVHDYSMLFPIRYVNIISDGEVALECPTVPRQMDTANDCGVHVMLMALKVMENKKVCVFSKFQHEPNRKPIVRCGSNLIKHLIISN